MLCIPNETGDGELTHSVDCCCMLTCLHNDEVDKANVLDDPIAKIPAKGLPNLDTIAEPEVWELTWLHCRQHKLSSGPIWHVDQALNADVDETVSGVCAMEAR